MSKKIWIGLVVVLLIVVIVFVMQKKRQPQQEEIRIGAILPLTGDGAFYGESIKQAIDFAIEEINESGGIKDCKLKIIFEDSKGSPKDGVAAFTKLVSFDKVPAVIGDAVSSVTLAIAPIANEKKVVVLSPLSSSPEITNAGDFIFRNVPSDFLGGKVAAHFAVTKQGWKSLAVLFVNNDFGAGLAKVFSEEVSVLGGEIFAKEAYSVDSTNFRTQLTKIKSANPDAIFLVSYREASTILIQAKELGMTSKFLGTGLLEDPKIIEIANKAAEGVFLTQLQYSADSPTSLTNSFVKAFTKKYNSEPSILAAYGYDSLKILASAIEKSNLTPESIRDELYKIKDYEGVTGKISFDENGDVVQPMGVKIIQDGKFIWHTREVSLD